jgi:Oxidoreductase family, NAD-binding Rossmann fold
MARQTICIIVNGATGRIGSTQHLANALVPIIAEGGLALEQDLPRLLLVSRDAERLAAVARNHKLADWTTDLDAALTDPAYAIFFDAAATQQRVCVLEKALAAGKHVYCEKPVAPNTAQALTLLREAGRRGLKHGVVEDKVHLPGLSKLATLVARGELGRLVGFRLDFGWWVFDGSERPCQRPSWDYRAGGGGIILDMYPHWRYVIGIAIERGTIQGVRETRAFPSDDVPRKGIGETRGSARKPAGATGEPWPCSGSPPPRPAHGRARLGRRGGSRGRPAFINLNVS